MSQEEMPTYMMMVVMMVARFFYKEFWEHTLNSYFSMLKAMCILMRR
jgi:hypothetical protein